MAKAYKDLYRSLTNEEINALPVVHYEGPVHLIRSRSDWTEACEDLHSSTVLGFDTETKPTFHKGRVNRPALVQLATANSVYLIQLTWLPFGKFLADILGNPQIIKAGVGIRCDMQALANMYPFVPQGLIDIGSIAKQNRLAAQGLRTLSAALFGWRISKGSQCSNWGLEELSAKQIIYAATDAWIGRLIYLKMKELNLNFNRQNEKTIARPPLDRKAPHKNSVTKNRRS